MGVVHVQQGVVLAGQGGEGRQVGRVPGHGVDAVQAEDPRRAGGTAQPPLGVLEVVVAEPPHGGARAPGQGGRVVEGPVGAQVEQQRPSPVRAGSTPKWMWVSVGRARASSTPSSCATSASTCWYRAGLGAVHQLERVQQL